MSAKPKAVASRPAARASRVNPYELIKEAIVSGEFDPGEPLVESTLATWCGVSRTPIREALRRLEQDGLLAWTELGLAVRKRTPQEILDVYDMRILLESTAARIAAERRTAADIALLRASVDFCRQVDDSDRVAKMRANRVFHRLVWQAAHNDSVSDLLDRLVMHLVQQPGVTLQVPGRWALSIDAHAEMVDAIERRDGDEADRLTHVHFADARDLRLKLFAASESE